MIAPLMSSRKLKEKGKDSTSLHVPRGHFVPIPSLGKEIRLATGFR